MFEILAIDLNSLHFGLIRRSQIFYKNSVHFSFFSTSVMTTHGFYFADVFFKAYYFGQEIGLL